MLSTLYACCLVTQLCKDSLRAGVMGNEVVRANLAQTKCSRQKILRSEHAHHLIQVSDRSCYSKEFEGVERAAAVLQSKAPTASPRIY